MFDPVYIDALALALFAGLLVLAAVHDMRAFRIPNRVCAAIAILFPVHVLTAPAPVDWLWAIAIAVAVFAVGATLFSFRLMGGGDVKMFAAVALWAGPGHALDFLLLTSVVGGVMALVMSSRIRFGLAVALESLGRKGARDAVLGSSLPYGIAIAAGGLFVAYDLWVKLAIG